MGYVLCNYCTIIMAPAWLVECCELDRTLHVYAGVGVIHIAFLGMDPNSVGRRQYINRLRMAIATLYRSTDGYLLPNKQTGRARYEVLRTTCFQQVTGIATCRGDGELIYRVHTTHQNEKMKGSS